MHKKHTLTRKNESGFTLIELMVVMAIIAILATAGLSGYTGYIKKARDMTRIADLNAINTIILSEIGSTGLPPDTSEKLYNTILEANNGTLLTDPLVYLDTPDNTYYQHYTKEVCQLGGARTTLGDCYYSYRLCDGNSGYAVGARFESVSNI
jgi:prepilin-type N-terminal cleavage/methylation domain-containing protein